MLNEVGAFGFLFVGSDAFMVLFLRGLNLKQQNDPSQQKTYDPRFRLSRRPRQATKAADAPEEEQPRLTTDDYGEAQAVALAAEAVVVKPRDG